MAANLDTDLIEDRTPLVTQGMQIIPTGSTRFKTSDTPVVYFEVYEPLLGSADLKEPVAVAVQFRVLDKGGVQKSDTGLLRIPVPEKSTNPMVPLGMKVPVASLAPGSYRVVLSAFDSAGGGMQRIAEFEIQ